MPSSADLPLTTDTIYNLLTPLIVNCLLTIPLSYFLPLSQITYSLRIKSAKEFFIAALRKFKKRQVKRLICIAALKSSKNKQVKQLVRIAALKSSKNKEVKRLVHIACSFFKARELLNRFYAKF